MLTLDLTRTEPLTEGGMHVRKFCCALVVFFGFFLFVGCGFQPKQVKQEVLKSPSVVTDPAKNTPVDAVMPSTMPPAPEVPKSSVAPVLPATPIWAQPGQHLAAAEPHGGAYQAYSPITFKGQSLVPIQTPFHFLIILREDNRIYLMGRYRSYAGVTLLEQPQLLFELPHHIGQEWTISFEADGSDTTTYRVITIAEAETPAGRLPVVAVELTGKQSERRIETWAPGYGLVGLAFGDRTTYTAARLVTAESKPFPGAGHLAPDHTAMLIDGRTVGVLVGMDGEELGRVHTQTVRDSIRWRKVGSEEFLWQESPISDFASAWRAYVFHESRLQPVRWVSPDWDNTYLPVAANRRDGAGINVRFDSDGTITYEGTGTQEGKTYDYRWDGSTRTFRGELRK